MSDKLRETQDSDGKTVPVPTSDSAAAADAAAAAPKQDELQKKREAIADAGLAHASLNNGQPHTKEEFSEAERLGDEARQFPDNVSEQTKRANKENDEAVGAPSAPGQPAVGSNPLRDPGVDSSDLTPLPEGELTPSDTVKGSGDGEDSQDAVEGDNDDPQTPDDSDTESGDKKTYVVKERYGDADSGTALEVGDEVELTDDEAKSVGFDALELKEQ